MTESAAAESAENVLEWVRFSRALARELGAKHSPEIARRIALWPCVHALAQDRGFPVNTARRLLLDDLDVTLPDAAIPPPVDVEALGASYEGLLSEGRRTGGERKQRGQFYTGRLLARATVERCLAPWRDDGSLLDRRVCDPASGAGAFLIEAARLSRRSLRAPAEAIARTLHGVDIDPTATRLCRLSLWFELGDPELDPDGLRRQIRTGDSTIGCWNHSTTDRAALDRSCAREFRRADPETPATVSELRERHRFFHWHVEFSEVFARGGFDAVVGNPPWEIQKADSRGFFERVDPDYRRLGKQEALRAQQRLFDAHPGLELEWQLEQRDRKLRANFHRSATSPLRHQGVGDANCYKRFVELAHLLLRDGGRLGLIVPSGLYTDRGSAPLRQLLLDHARWEWLFGFENRRNVFPIDNRFKFAAVVATKGGRTTAINTAFMRHDPAEWIATAPDHIPYSRDEIDRFSPSSSSLLEFRSRRDVEVFERIYDSSTLLCDATDRGWRTQYRRELDLTLDSAKFPPRDDWEARGYVPDIYGRWLACDRIVPRARAGTVELRDERFAVTRAIEAVAVPLYEGRMIGQFDFSQKGWVNGRGRRARWREIPDPVDWRGKSIEPQFLLSECELPRVDSRHRQPKVAFMAIGSASNQRSMIATVLVDTPCGNSVPTLRCRAGLELILCAVLNSYVYDYALRLRLGGVNLNRFILDDTPLPDWRALAAIEELPALIAGLTWPQPRFARSWLELDADRGRPWLDHWAIDHAERRRRRCAIDAIVAAAYGLDAADLGWVLRDCDLPSAEIHERQRRNQLDPKGFWRTDSELEVPDRATQGTLRAFETLRREIDARGGDFVAGGRAFCRRVRAASAPKGERPAMRAGGWAACEEHAAAVGGSIS